MPKTLIKALDPSDVLHVTLSITRHNQLFGPVIALGAVDSYFEAAKRQQLRIEKAKAGLARKATARTRSLFDEVHFYLICWARIAKLTRFIARSTRFRRTGLVLRRYHAELTERVDCRDHLEHFEERLPGGPRRHELAIPGDLLNMSGHFLTYGGRKLDVGPASALLLRAIVTEFHAALLFDSVEALAAAEPNQVLTLLRSAASRVHLGRVAKQFKKLVGSNTRGGAKQAAEQRASPDADEPRR